jgi:hypothetical protein
VRRVHRPDHADAGPPHARPRPVAAAEPDTGRGRAGTVEPLGPAALVAPLADARHVGQHGPHRLRRRIDDDLDRAGLRQPPLRATSRRAGVVTRPVVCPAAAMIASWARFRPYVAASRNQPAITAVGRAAHRRAGVRHRPATRPAFRPHDAASTVVPAHRAAARRR